jgi:hypothetical protein
LHAGDGVAAVDRARVAVCWIERRAGIAAAGTVTGFGAVADVAVGAAGAGADGVVLDAGYRIAAVGGARVAIFRIEGGAWLARASGVAEFGAVADVAVGAAGAGCDGGVLDAADGVAAVGRARIAVFWVERGAGLAAAHGVAEFGAVADVAVGAAGASGDGFVLYAGDGVAAVGCAGVAVFWIEGGTGLAGSAGVADFVAIAEVAVGAANSWGGLVLYAGYGVAGVGGARVLVVNVEGGAGLADGAGVAGFFSVADVAVGAAAAGGQRGVGDAGDGVAAVGGASDAPTRLRFASACLPQIRAHT